MTYRPDYPAGDHYPWSNKAANDQPNPVHWSQDRYQKPYNTSDFGHYSIYPPQSDPTQQIPLPNAKPQKSSRKVLLVAGTAVVAVVAGVGGTLALDRAESNAQTNRAAATLNAQTPQPLPAVPAKDSAPAGSVEQVSAKVLPSVVKLQVQTAQGSGEGSGIILSSDGLILTNNHVVAEAAGTSEQLPSRGAPDQQQPRMPRGMIPRGMLPPGMMPDDQYPGDDGSGAQSPYDGPSAAPSGRNSQGPKATVTLADGRTVPFTVVGTDPEDDIAVVKAENVSGLTPISIGSSKDLRVGQNVVAIGSPLGLQGTVTTGIISSLDRPVATGDEQGSQHSVMNAIQTDAAINPGNSGGALVDMNGNLIGVNSAIASLGGGGSGGGQAGSIGLGFAIPVDQAKRIADQLVSNGSVQHASLGVKLADNAGGSGAAVAAVANGSPAAAAGLPKGAVITKVDDHVIDGPDALVATIRSKAPGDNVALTFDDPSGASHTIQVTLGQTQS